jgi:hypothetical protein
MGWSTLASAAIGMGQADAKNPGASLGGSGEHQLLGQLDPLGKFIVGKGGDPLNLYGEKDNPGALFFPSGSGDGMGLPTTLTPNGPVNPMLYDPNSFAPRRPSGPGAFNAMAAELAGPAYQPRRMPVQAPSSPVGSGAGMGMGGMTPPMYGGAEPGMPDIRALLQQYRSDQPQGKGGVGFSPMMKRLPTRPIGPQS